MKKRSKHKKPIGRLILAFFLAGLLLSAGTYALYKRNLAKGVSFTQSLSEFKDWFIEHKNKLHAEIKNSKKIAQEEAVRPKPVKFEFYNSLASSSVQVDAAVGKAAPVIPIATRVYSSDKITSQKPSIEKSKTVVVSHDELEKELQAHVEASQNDDD